MEYRKLGQSKLELSIIGFGCMSLGEEDVVSTRLIHHALDAGVNFFDTADLYRGGLNEESVGKALLGRRQQAIIATKAGNQLRKDGSGWDWNPRKEYILECCDKSLSRLQTDYIDLYQLHGGTIDDPIDETIEAFEILRQQGKILNYGISSIRPNVIREYVSRSNIVSVMMQYSLLDRRPEFECLSLLQENNIGMVARGTLAGGLLAGKNPSPYLSYDPTQVEQVANAVAGISGVQRTAAQTALRFVLQEPATTSAVVGIRNEKQLEEVLATTSTPFLTTEELALLKNTVIPNRYEAHL